MTARPLAALIARILLAYALVAQGIFGGAAIGAAAGRSLAPDAFALGLCHGAGDPADRGNAAHLPDCCQAGCLPFALPPGVAEAAPLDCRLHLAAFSGAATGIAPPRAPSPFDATGPPPTA